MQYDMCISIKWKITFLSSIGEDLANLYFRWDIPPEIRFARSSTHGLNEMGF